jgi:hypothetical protein
VFFPGKALFLGGEENAAVLDQGHGAVVEKSRNT